MRNGLTNQSGGRVEIYPNIVLPALREWNDAGGSTTVIGTIAGSGGILKTGSGTLLLDASANSYTGGNIISGGVLRVRTPAALGAASSTIQIDDAILRIANTGSAVLPQDLSLAPGTAVIQAREMDFTISGVISGVGTLRLEPDSSYSTSPPARYVLSNINSYAGGTEVDRVTLKTVGTSQSLGLGNVTLKDGAVLRLTASSNLATDKKVTMEAGSTFVLNNAAISPYDIIEKDPTKITGGTLALTTATSGLSLDMAAIGNGELFLGSSENIAYTGTLGPGAGGVYRIGGGSGDTVSFPTLTFGGRENIFTGANSIVFGSNSEVNPQTDTRDNSTVLLTHPNDYSGGTILRGGTLVIGDDRALGSGVFTFAGGRLSTTGSLRTLANRILFQGPPAPSAELIPAGDLTFAGPVDLGGGTRRLTGPAGLITFSNVVSNGALTLDAGRWAMLGENTFVGGLTLENSGWLDIAEDRSLGGVGAALTLQTSTLHPIASVVIRRPIEVQGFNSIVVDTDQTTILEGPVTGSSGVLFKAGGGTLTFRGDTQQFGGMAIQAGTLRLENTGAPSPGIFVHPSGTLSGNGRASLVVVNAGAHLAPGAEMPGELSIRFLQIDPGAILDFDLGVAAFDLIRIVSDSVHVVPGEPLIVNLADAGGLANDQIYTLIDFSAATGISDITASDFFLGTSPVQGTFSIAENTLLFTTVPEPSLGILVLASLPLLQGRRRLRVNR